MAAVMDAVAWLVDDPPNEMDSIVPRRDLNYCLFGPYLLRKVRFWDLIFSLPLFYLLTATLPTLLFNPPLASRNAGGKRASRSKMSNVTNAASPTAVSNLLGQSSECDIGHQ